MKVIDMLTKIANGEEVRFVILNDESRYNLKKGQNLYNEDDERNVEWYIDEEWLNEEVKVIEKNEVPEKLNNFRFEKETKDLTDEELVVENYLIDVSDKINEIIDYLKED